MVPLIDVMLVLLVIFIVTAPLLTHAVKIDLPKASSEVNPTQRENVQLAIAANGDIHWNGELVDPFRAGAALCRGRAQPAPAGTSYPGRPDGGIWKRRASDVDGRSRGPDTHRLRDRSDAGTAMSFRGSEGVRKRAVGETDLYGYVAAKPGADR